jgi:DNA-binding transcriptional LysR family regulator
MQLPRERRIVHPGSSLTIASLRIFESVGRQCNFSRAAEELGVSQPYVSTQIAELEVKLRIMLFRRVGRRVYLADAGKLLYNRALSLLDSVADAERAISELREVVIGRVELATVIIAAEFVVPGALAAFRAQHPEASVNMRVLNSSDVEETVLRGQCDIGITLSHTHATNLHVEPFATDEVAAVVGLKHPSAGRKTIDAHELAGEKLLAREPTSGTRMLLESRLAELGIRPQYIFEVSSNQVIKALARAGVGVAVLSTRTVAAEVSLGLLRCVPIVGIELKRAFSIISRQNETLSPSANAFRTVVLSLGADAGPSTVTSECAVE